MITEENHELRKTYWSLWLTWILIFAIFLVCIAICYKISITLQDIFLEIQKDIGEERFEKILPLAYIAAFCLIALSYFIRKWKLRPKGAELHLIDIFVTGLIRTDCHLRCNTTKQYLHR